MTYNKTLLLSGIAALTMAGCGGSGGETPAPEAVGFLSLGISDGPIHSAQRVCIEFNSIEMKQMGGDSILVEFDEPEKVDLLSFQGANAMPLLVNHEMPAGEYEWMRLGVNAVRGSNGGAGETDPALCDGEASYIVMDDETVHNLYVPSGENTGLKLVSGYTVPTNDTTSLTLEFDLAKSIKTPRGQSPDVMLRPTIRLVDNNEVGVLTGQVANELAEAQEPVPCEPSVYLFDNGVTPNGIDFSEDAEVDPNDPIATALVERQDQTDGTHQWHYTIGFLLTGEYVAAFTCDNETFEPAEGLPAMIYPGEITTVDFEVPEETPQ